MLEIVILCLSVLQDGSGCFCLVCLKILLCLMTCYKFNSFCGWLCKFFFKCLEAPNHLNWSDDLYMYFQCINRNLEVQTCLQKNWFTIFSLPLSSFFNSLLEVSEWFKITGGNVLCILFLKLYNKLYQSKWQYMYTVILLSYVVKLGKVWNWDS